MRGRRCRRDVAPAFNRHGVGRNASVSGANELAQYRPRTAARVANRARDMGSIPRAMIDRVPQFSGRAITASSTARCSMWRSAFAAWMCFRGSATPADRRVARESDRQSDDAPRQRTLQRSRTAILGACGRHSPSAPKTMRRSDFAMSAPSLGRRSRSAPGQIGGDEPRARPWRAAPRSTGAGRAERGLAGYCSSAAEHVGLVEIGGGIAVIRLPPQRLGAGAQQPPGFADARRNRQKNDWSWLARAFGQRHRFQRGGGFIEQ